MVMQHGKSLRSFSEQPQLSPKIHYKIKHEAAKLAQAQLNEQRNIFEQISSRLIQNKVAQQ